MKMKFILFCGFFFQVSVLVAQFNIKVGYAGAYYNLSEINSQFAAFNAAEENAFYDDPYPKTHVLHGLEAGFRFKIGRHMGVEATWSNGQSKRITTSGFNANEVFIENKWRVSSNEYSIGVENYFGTFGYGASIGNGKATISKFKSGSRKYLDVQEDKYVNLRFNLIFTVETGNGSFAFKPFYQTPLEGWNLKAFANNLNPDLTYVDKQVNFTSFGLSLVFYNGPKKL